MILCVLETSMILHKTYDIKYDNGYDHDIDSILICNLQIICDIIVFNPF